MLFQCSFPFNKDVSLQTQNMFTDSTDADTGGRAVAGIAGSNSAGAWLSLVSVAKCQVEVFARARARVCVCVCVIECDQVQQ
jgi:hypothetical protein